MRNKSTFGTLGFAALTALLLLAGTGCGTSERTTIDVGPDSAAVSEPFVAEIGGEKMLLSEFEERYARSVGGVEAAQDDSLGLLRDFLERYVDFRLKVSLAEDAGVADRPSLRNEVNAYRVQLARPYILDRDYIKPVLEKLLERKQYLVDASHLLIRVPENPTPADTLNAYNLIASIVDSIRAGADFGEMAYRHSDDPSARGDQAGALGRLGYFGAGQMVAPFEDNAYETAPGEISPVFRTQFGYHVLKVHDRKESKPDVRAAHIFIRPGGTTPEDSASALRRMEAIQARLQSGEDFAQVARLVSEDQGSAERGGDIGMITYTDRRIPDSFKDPLFALENVGDITPILITPFGYHIATITERMAPETHEEALESLRPIAQRMPQIRSAEQYWYRDLLETYDATADTALLERTLGGLPVGDSLLIGTLVPDSALAHPVATLGDSTYSIRGLLQFADSSAVYEPSDSLYSAPLVRRMIDAFMTQAAASYEARALEQRDPEFGLLMEEFSDGLLLFAVMQDSVWGRASQDTSALEAYHAPRADDYWFPERTRLIAFYSPSDSLLREAADALEAGTSIATLQQRYASDSTVTVRIDTTYMTGQNNSIFDRALSLPKGDLTEPLTYVNQFVMLMNDGSTPARQKTFEEALPELINEYQALLEERLVRRLRVAYDVRTYPEVLKQAFKDTAASTPSLTSPDTP